MDTHTYMHAFSITSLVNVYFFTPFLYVLATGEREREREVEMKKLGQRRRAQPLSMN